MKSHMRVRALCEGAVLVAVAQILSYLKLWEMPSSFMARPIVWLVGIRK